jgi:hypothetical protein
MIRKRSSNPRRQPAVGSTEGKIGGPEEPAAELMIIDCGTVEAPEQLERKFRYLTESEHEKLAMR